MERLKSRILNDGMVIGDGILKVDSFLNHQIDVKFMEEIGAEFKKRFADKEIDKILTVESSGIAIACEASKYFGYVPVVFAKKAAPNTMAEKCYSEEARSFTKGTVSKLRVVKRFLEKGENVLIIDDFLATGEAAVALVKIAKKAEVNIVGVGTVIEKEFQEGGQRLREMGCRVESLAVIKGFEEGKPVFR